jgi:chromosome segregation ATPase
MKSIPMKALLLFLFFVLTFGYPSSAVYAQNESESSIHELPRAYQCDVITINIRELAFSRKQVLKEISSLEKPAGQASESSEYYEQQMNQYRERMEALQERVFSLQEQIDTNEQQLENCLQYSSISPRANKSETAQKKRETE